MNSVKLISVSKPVTDDIRTSEQLIAYCARVSNPNNQLNTATTEKLLKYCIEHNHWSIFEMVHIVMEINTTRDIARQILRHRSFSFQEFSQRYAEVQNMAEPRETRLQDIKNRQNSLETNDVILARMWEAKQQQIIHETNLAYKWAIQNGIAKEQARSVLPEGLTLSRMYMAGTLRSWIHYYTLRLSNGTQKEHREIARECRDIIYQEFPSIKNIV